MKKVAKRVVCIALILACLLAYAPQVWAEQVPDRPDELYLTQNVTGTCTLCSSAMMIRTSMYLHGNNNWSKVTENALRPYAWLSGVGLYWNFTYTLGSTTVKVGHQSVNGMTEAALKKVLDEHPEGIVLYCGNLPHAVFLTGYVGDVFYCADTVQGISEKQVTLKKSWLGIMYGSQAAVLKKVTAYWYVTDYMENGQSVGYCDCDRTHAGTYKVNYASGVNIRAGHGTNNDLLGAIPYGAEVVVTKSSGSGSGHWAHVTYNGITGYISMAYIQKVPCDHKFGDWSTSSVAGQEIRTCEKCSATESRQKVPGKMGTVNADGLNVRSAPGTGNSLVEQLWKGNRVEVYETKQADGLEWGRIDTGWVCMKYVDLDKAGTMGTVTGSSVNIREGAGTDYFAVGTKNAGDRVEVFETKEAGGLTWGRIREGWICMDYVELDEQEAPIATGTVISANGKIDWLNVRADAGSGYPQVGRLEIGEKVELLEIKQVGTQQWGRIAEGWVLMDYVKLDTTETPIATGTVTGLLNIRANAGTQYSKVGQLQAGTTLEFYEFKQVGTAQWGRISNGWVLMDYVKLDGAEEESETIIGTVTGNGVRIRKSAVDGDVVGQYYAGEQVEILETKVVNGITWGRTDKGWICMDYVDYVR